MIDMDDVFYMDGKLFVVRFVAATTYMCREYLGHGELGGYYNFRHEQVEFNRTLSFEGTWDEGNNQILWDKTRRPVELPPAPRNVIAFEPKKKSLRKEHNDRVINSMKDKQ